MAKKKKTTYKEAKRAAKALRKHFAENGLPPACYGACEGTEKIANAINYIFDNVPGTMLMMTPITNCTDPAVYPSMLDALDATIESVNHEDPHIMDDERICKYTEWIAFREEMAADNRQAFMDELARERNASDDIPEDAKASACPPVKMPQLPCLRVIIHHPLPEEASEK